MYKKPQITCQRKQDGIAMIEALMAICLFSLGILALVGMQAVMAKNVTQSKLRGEASFLANQLVGQMWVDQSNLSKYAIADGECTDDSYTKCTTWLATVNQFLPGGTAEVAIDATSVDVTISWQLPGEGEVPGTFQISADITN